jgi:hypothetical protein
MPSRKTASWKSRPTIPERDLKRERWISTSREFYIKFLALREIMAFGGPPDARLRDRSASRHSRRL